MNQKIEKLHALQAKLSEVLEKSHTLTVLYHEVQMLTKELEQLENTNAATEAESLLTSL